ncbi:metalloprotease [Coemansia sp. RSA 989]|nr:Metalloenzyme, LuxS/M16 peptidase-like protein [Coemansia mojavensis]KAJ1866020.1 metalloprotease [Coemansia sp. RSA 989]KAJ1873327.1 metalloprotease [Coemansia sp. RSA 990]
MGRIFETHERLPSREENRFLPPVVSFEDFVERKTAHQQLAFTEFTGDLKKSPSDSRSYRLIRLHNGLVAMVVHDEEESKACASLDVNVGSLADPFELQGLAHFCEHLLFMGTKKYPAENEYNAYLSAHGGYANAYTDLEDTCYFFEVTYDALEGALDRFSQFFIDPLFTADCTDREVRAVDSEHKKNIQNDMWRKYQLEKELSSPQHPFSMFATGSQDTLSGAAQRLGVDLRERLLDFHAKYYSADIMRLVVVGRDSLDQLTEWVVSRFSGIRSKGMTKPLFKGHPLTPREMGTLIRMQSIREKRSLDLIFSMPDMKPYFGTKPTHYLGSLLGHEGRGSILSLLRKRGWATSLVAGRSPTSAEGFDMFKVSVSLTESGLDHYEDVIRAIFAYIQLLRAQPPQKWFHDELRRIGEIEYRFMEKFEAVALASRLANVMQNRYLTPSRILSDEVIFDEFDSDLIEWVQGFLAPDNVRIMLAARELPVEFDRTEPHYGIKYRVDPIPEQLKQDIRGKLVFDELQLPEPNRFIPDNLEVKYTKQKDRMPAEAPTLLKLTEGLELWFKPDDRFFLPRGNVRLLLETPRAYESPLNSVLNQLFVMIIKDSLTEITYDAEIAGLWFEIRSTVEGILVHIDGFNDKLMRLLRTLVETLRTFRVDATQFEVFSHEVRKKLDNARHAEPHSHVQTNTGFMNQAVMWRYMDKLAAFELVTQERLQLFINTLFDQTRLQMLVLGNFDEQDALDASDMVKSLLNCQPLPEYARRVSRATLHDPGVFVHHDRMPEDGNLNSCVDLSVFTGLMADRRNRVLLDLVSLIMKEPFFDQLRTKEQLGYITYSTERKYTGGYMSLCLLVQSESNPSYVRMRIEKFIRGFRQRLVDMSESSFAGYVNSLRVNLEERLKNMFEESGRLWRAINMGFYEFDRIPTDISTLMQLTQADVVAFWDKFVNRDTASEYKALAATIWSTKITQPTEAQLEQYPACVIALAGCLEHDGAVGLSYEDISSFVHKELPSISAGDSTARAEEEALEALLAKYLGKVNGDDEQVAKALAKIRDAASYVRTAISMAREYAEQQQQQQQKPAMVNGQQDVEQAKHANGLFNIGAVKSHGGDWVFREAARFKSTLRQSGAPVPTRPLVPKY